MKELTIHTASLKNLKRIDQSKYDQILVVMRFKPKDKNVEFTDKIKWEPKLSPSKDLLLRYNSGGLIWQTYVNDFHKEKETDKAYINMIEELTNDIIYDLSNILIVCKCETDKCHRFLVANDIISSVHSINKYYIIDSKEITRTDGYDSVCEAF